jgi:signal transduction histidine kinase
VGTWAWNRESGRVTGSAQQFRLHALAPGRALSPAEVLASIHPEDRERVARALAEAAAERRPLELEYRVVWPDENVHWLSCRGVYVPVDPRRPDGAGQMVGVSIDITGRKQMEEAVRRGERLASLGTFAAGVAHEINNPLGTILLAADSARGSLEDRHAVEKALDDIVEDAERAARIVKSVLQFSKAEETERVVLDVNDCVLRAVDLARHHCLGRGVALEVDLAAGPLECRANATELEQVFVNLLRNAAEACRAGGHVRIHTSRGRDDVVACVSDDGSGMSDEARARAFDPFYTTRLDDGGSGLGMSICFGIIESHGGGMHLESEPGVGTVVRVWIPRAPGPRAV